MELAEKQLQEFSDQGFVNVGRIFDERQLATISAEYDRLVTQEAQVLGPAPESLEQIRATPADSILSRLANPGLVLPIHSCASYTRKE